MVTIHSAKDELLSEIENAFRELKEIVKPLNQQQINTAPYKDSWTAAQLLNHVTKSTSAIALAMQAPAEAAGRDPGERAIDLRDTFLDFTMKLNAPDFIVPDDGLYQKEEAINSLARSCTALTKAQHQPILAGL